MTRYPDISRYRETMLNPAGLFRTLENVIVEKDCYGDVFFIAGSNSVIFKAHISGRVCALKCFTKYNPRIGELYSALGRTDFSDENHYLIKPSWLEDEIFIYDDEGNGRYYPVVIYDYIEGVSLRNFLAEKCHTQKRSEIAAVAEKFDRMALWLLEKEFAHGDIKPDNIIVSTNGNLHLADLDGMFIPDVKESISIELGTKYFQHPARTRKFFNRHTDDYSIALISTALHGLAEFPEILTETGEDDDKLLFYPVDLVGGSSKELNFLKNHWLETGRTDLYALTTTLGSPTPEIKSLYEKLSSIVHSEKDVRYHAFDERENMTIISRDGFFGYRNESTGKIIQPVYDEARPFGDGVAAVRIMKKWMLIDTEGVVVAKLDGFSDIGTFKNGMARAQKGKKQGFIDKTGEIIISLLYDSVRNFSEGLAGVSTGGKYGFIDAEGKFIIKPRFDSVLDFHEGLAVAETGGKFGYIDQNGDFVIAPQFDFASGFRNGEATVEKDGKTFTITRQNY